jgi:hypothetical protein
VIPELKVEAIHIIEALLGCEEAREITPYQAACYKDVLKYTLRCLKKGSFLEDLKKTQTYIQFIVEDIEGKKENGNKDDRPNSRRIVLPLLKSKEKYRFDEEGLTQREGSQSLTIGCHSGAEQDSV